MKTTGTTVTIAVFLAVSAVQLAAQLATMEWLADASKPLLMPALLLTFATMVPLRASRLTRLCALALAFSWFGDIGLIPEGDTWFLIGLAMFGVAHLVYCAAFWPYRATSPIWARPALAAPYVLAWAVLIAVLARSLDGLLIPVALYGIVIIAMAILATSINTAAAVGAGLFVLSDSLIAIDRFLENATLPSHGFWVMATYLAGQALIILGAVARVRDRRPAGLISSARRTPRASS